MAGSGQQAEAGNDRNKLDAIKSSIPGGLAGGAAAGTVMALLMSNKSARKLAGKAAAYGGTALLGGLAYKGYQNWKDNQSLEKTAPISHNDIEQSQNLIPASAGENQPPLHLTMIKAMIAAAKSDGHIDATEQKNIFDAVEKMNLPADEKAMVFDSMGRDISVHELAASVSSIDHKSEVYLSSYLAIELDHPSEREHLNNLAEALSLPQGLPEHLEKQAMAGIER